MVAGVVAGLIRREYILLSEEFLILLKFNKRKKLLVKKVTQRESNKPSDVSP